MSASMLGLALLLAALGVLAGWCLRAATVRRQRDHGERAAIERDLRESELQLRLATEMAGIAIWHYDFSKGRMFRTRNHDALYGMAWQPIWVVDTFLNATHPDDRERSHQIIQQSMAPHGPDDYAFDFRVIKPDGSTCWLWVRGRVTERDASGQGTALRGVLVDVSERKATEAKLALMTRLYAVLSQCNQAIVRCTDEAELFTQICRDAVEHGGMRMAWIGWLDETQEQVRPAAAFGVGSEYLQGQCFDVSDGSPHGQGPVACSLRAGEPRWCDDFQHAPATAPWREPSRQYGWQSSAALPLRCKGRIVAALGVYADLPAAFDAAARQLLVEMAADISFALDHFVDERQRKQALEELHVSNQRLHAIFETEPDGVLVIGAAGALQDVNRMGLAILELDTVAEAAQHNLPDFLLPVYREAFRAMQQRVMRGGNGALECEIVGRAGTRRWLEIHAAPLRDADGAVASLIGIATDITERKRTDHLIRQLANYDVLTGLPNRNQLAERMQETIAQARQQRGGLCIMCVDLDQFKDINDALGHGLGDTILVETAYRLKAVLRDSDLVARTGGDEFVLLLPDSDARGAEQVASKLLAAFAEPFHLGAHKLRVTASVGIAVYPDDGGELEALSRSAETAMYRAKQEGRNSYRFFTAAMEQRATRQMQLTNALHRALEQGQLRLHYQPQIELATGAVVGVEALLRWRHPELGEISPAEFIPVAEYSGLIVPIGEWVMRTATQQLRHWMDEGMAPIVMAVNLSARQFRDQALVQRIDEMLAAARLSAASLEIELTESVAMHDPQGAIAIMRTLHERGIRISIDDFGTGYSSLSYLKQFPIDRLKIDQSFVRDMGGTAEEQALVTAIIRMSHSLGLRTIAEGVETAAQQAILAALGCDEVQGYFYCKPVPAEEVAAYLRQRAHAAEPTPG